MERAELTHTAICICSAFPDQQNRAAARLRLAGFGEEIQHKGAVDGDQPRFSEGVDTVAPNECSNNNFDQAMAKADEAKQRPVLAASARGGSSASGQRSAATDPQLELCRVRLHFSCRTDGFFLRETAGLNLSKLWSDAVVFCRPVSKA
jgi:hypothetical protein